MLQNIRQNVQGTAAKIVVGLIVLTFSIFGIESILVGGGNNAVAEVNGEDVTPMELEQSLDSQRRRLISMMGENIDPTMLDDERLRAPTLEALIDRKLLTQSATAMNLTVSEREIGSVVSGMEQFQVDGKFSPDLYKSMLAGAGYTPSYFKESLRADLAQNQLRSGLAGTEFSTANELKLNAQVLGELRDFAYITIPLEAFRSDLEIADSEIEAHYNANQTSFQTPESVDLEYIELQLDTFREPVEESAIVSAFETAKADFSYKPQNRVSHIFFESTDKDSIAERVSEAKSRLDAGEDFADVARDVSEDAGTADRGGDLGFSSGDAFPAEMEAALESLEPGTVFGPLETSDGTHLIMVTERNSPKVPTLEDMREQLEERLQSEQAKVALIQNVEQLRDAVFNAEDLKDPAASMDLQVKRADKITRTQGDGLFSNPVLLETAFSDQLLVSGHNSDVIELASDTFVVLRVRQHNSPTIKPLEVVQSEIVAAISERRAQEAMVSEAIRILERLRTGDSIDEVADNTAYTLTTELAAGRQSASVPREVLNRIFELPRPPADEISTDYTVSRSGDAIVLMLSNVSEGQLESMSSTEQSQLRQQVDGEKGFLIDTEFQRGLRQQAEIVVL